MDENREPRPGIPDEAGSPPSPGKILPRILDEVKSLLSPRRTLLRILEEAKSVLSRPDNEFGWSSFRGTGDALDRIDYHLDAVARGDRTRRMELILLFAPTGAIQEVSLSSGWGDEYCALAARFDAVQQA